MTQNKSPSPLGVYPYDIEDQIGVVKEGYIELLTIAPRKKSLLCCFKKNKKQEPSIVDA